MSQHTATRPIHGYTKPVCVSEALFYSSTAIWTVLQAKSPSASWWLRLQNWISIKKNKNKKK